MESAYLFSFFESGIDEPNPDVGIEKMHLGGAEMILGSWAKLPKGETDTTCCLFFLPVIYKGELR